MRQHLQAKIGKKLLTSSINCLADDKVATFQSKARKIIAHHASYVTDIKVPDLDHHQQVMTYLIYQNLVFPLLQRLTTEAEKTPISHG